MQEIGGTIDDLSPDALRARRAVLVGAAREQRGVGQRAHRVQRVAQQRRAHVRVLAAAPRAPHQWQRQPQRRARANTL